MTEFLCFRADLESPAAVSSYDELSLWSSLAGRLLLDHVPLGRGWQVLDIGCGTGFPLLELAERLGIGSTVHGVDPWNAALERAKRKALQWGLGNVVVRHGDAATLPYADGQFDLIVSNLGINNFAAPAAALAECRRVAKPGARLALSTNLAGHMAEFYAVYAETLADLGNERAAEELRRHEATRPTIEGLTALVEAEGFEVRRIERDTALLRYVDGSALLRHHFVRLAFLDGWRRVVDQGHEEEAFLLLEANLNRLAERTGELRLTVPLAYVEAARA